MQTHQLETTTTTPKPHRSKYAPYMRAMLAALEQHGPDGKLRSFEHTANWRGLTVRRWAAALRHHSRGRLPAGVRLSVRTCQDNGIVFSLHKA